MAPAVAAAIPYIAGAASVASAGVGIVGAIQAQKERKSAKKEAARERSRLQAEEAKKREKQMARLTARGQTERGSILTSPQGVTGDAAVGRKRLLGE